MIAEHPSVYRPPEGVETTTKLSRGETIISVLDQVVMSEWDGNTPLSVGIIGIGYDSFPLCCPFEPFQLAAYCEADYVPYKFTLVDIDPTILADVQSRTKLVFVDSSDHPASEKDRNAWELYNGRMVQTDTITYNLHDPNIIFSPLTERFRHHNYTERVMNSGIHIAPIPDSFREAQEHNALALIQADIGSERTAGLLPLNHHFISCMNVLYHLDGQQQQSNAFHTLSQALRTGGYVLFNEAVRRPNGQILNQPYGWMTTNLLRDEFGFQEIPIPDLTHESSTHLLRKVS